MRGEMTLDPFITHTFTGLEGVNDSIKALHGGDCLRAVVQIGELQIDEVQSVAPLAWVPGNPSVLEQWVPEPITFETKK